MREFLGQWTPGGGPDLDQSGSGVGAPDWRQLAKRTLDLVIAGQMDPKTAWTYLEPLPMSPAEYEATAQVLRAAAR